MNILSKSVEEAQSQSVVLSLSYVGLGAAMGIGVFLQAFIHLIILNNDCHLLTPSASFPDQHVYACRPKADHEDKVDGLQGRTLPRDGMV